MDGEQTFVNIESWWLNQTKAASVGVHHKGTEITNKDGEQTFVNFESLWLNQAIAASVEFTTKAQRSQIRTANRPW